MSLTPKDWIPTDKKPDTYELCKIINDAGKCFYGWWTGQNWDGEKKEKFGDIVAWRKAYGSSVNK